MASYPSELPYCRGSERIIRPGTQIDVATDGTLRGRRFYAADLYEFHLVHHAISSTQRDTLLAFYETNKISLIEYTWNEDSAVYEVYFFPDAPRVGLIRGTTYTANVTLMGHAQ